MPTLLFIVPARQEAYPPWTMGHRKHPGGRIAALIFDLDGTLVDSGRDIALAANHGRAALGRPPLPEPLLISFVGDGVEMLVRRALAHDGPEPSEEEVRTALAALRDHYGRHCTDNTRPYPGVLEVLHHFRRLPLHVATNKPREYTERILRELSLAGAFRRVVAADDVTQRKPDPEPLRRCLEGLDVAPSAVAVVGDHPNDVLAARALGAVSVGAAYGLVPRERLLAAGPDHVIEKPLDLRELFPSRLTL